MKGCEQITMFGFVDEYETEQLPPEERKKDVKAWVIEAGPVAKGWGPDIAYWRAHPRRIIFERDAKWDDRYRKWDTFGHSLGGQYFGFYGGHGKMAVFRTRPTWQDCCVYVRKQREYLPGTEIRDWEYRPI